MPVFKNKTQGQYVNVYKDILKNHSLSLRDRGMVVTLLSLPDNWEFTISGLSKIIPDGKSSIRASLTHLEELGYISRTQERAERGNQRSSNKFAASGNRSALRLPGSFRRRGFQPDHFMETSLCGWAHSPRGTSCRPAHAAGGTLRQRGAFHAGCYAQGTLTQREFRQCCFF